MQEHSRASQRADIEYLVDGHAHRVLGNGEWLSVPMRSHWPLVERVRQVIEMQIRIRYRGVPTSEVPGAQSAAGPGSIRWRDVKRRLQESGVL